MGRSDQTTAAASTSGRAAIYGPVVRWGLSLSLSGELASLRRSLRWRRSPKRRVGTACSSGTTCGTARWRRSPIRSSPWRRSRRNEQPPPRHDGRRAARGVDRSSSPRPPPASIVCRAAAWSSVSASASTAMASSRSSTSRSPTIALVAEHSTPGSTPCCRCSPDSRCRAPVAARPRSQVCSNPACRSGSPGEPGAVPDHGRVPSQPRGTRLGRCRRLVSTARCRRLGAGSLTAGTIDVVLVGGSHPRPDALAAVGRATWCLPEILPGATMVEAMDIAGTPPP